MQDPLARLGSRALLAGLALVLFGGALALRLPSLDVLDLSSDATDPIVASLKVLEGFQPFFTDSPRFGYGRTLSYLPLAAGHDGGLAGYALRRAVAQALIASLVFLAVVALASRRSSARLATVAGVLAGALAACDPELQLNLTWGHHGYLGPEWSAVALLGFAWALTDPPRRRRGPALLGLGLAMAAMNHPYALSAFAILPVVAWQGRVSDSPRRGKRSPHALAAGVALALLAPHGLYLLQLEEGRFASDVLESLAPSVAGLVPAVTGLFGQVGPLRLGVFVLALAICLRPVLPRSSTERAGGARVLGLATLSTLVLVVLLAALSRQVHNWHGRHLVPWAAACIGLALVSVLPSALDRGAALRPRLVAVVVATTLVLGSSGALVTGLAAYRNPLAEPRDSLLQLATVVRVAAALDPARAPWALAGYLQRGSEADRSGSRADLFPVVLDRVMAGQRALFGTDPDTLQRASTLLFAEGDPPWIAALTTEAEARAGKGTAGVPPAARLEVWDARPGTLVVRAHHPAAAERLGRVACGIDGGGSVVGDDPRDGLALLGVVDWTEARAPGLHRCADPR